MTKDEIDATPRKEARQLLAQIPAGKGYDNRLLLAVEQAMNLEWWRGYHAAKSNVSHGRPDVLTEIDIAQICGGRRRP